jgi:7,8-dihydropterin-6-yl-methyl-4-(beta-D-ribofuranosyl)aminobenzene 5'-phosphate synthase
MGQSLDRRSFLQHSCLLGGSLFTCGIPLDRSANAAPVRIEAPVVEEVTIREVTDNAHDLFAKPFEAPGLKVTRIGTPEAAQGKTLASEWGLALHIESHKGQESHRYLLDFGFTPEVYANNIDLLKSTLARWMPSSSAMVTMIMSAA